ncbi:MAG: sodium-dependent transporter [Lachnospiraceae bacterium]|nr:sodium-dependent transporter [Lachnospiraceae bacterium]
MAEKGSDKRNTFTGSIGFVLAAAGSAVGLGNIWRFPYLAARDGGGLFLVIYLILVLTFGSTLVITEVSIGRKTRQSPLTAYAKLSKKWKPLGLLSCIVPMIILPYYCVIGGWVLKYFLAFISGGGPATASDGYFSTFITGNSSPIIMALLYLAMTMFVVFSGVQKGIEKFSKIIMPLLIVLILVIVFFSLNMSYTDEAGNVRTGMQGLKILFIPDLASVTLSSLLTTAMDAMGQLFYSLSVAMGILIAYGSYMPDDISIKKSVSEIEIFDTGIAFLAGMMIIPAVYVFMGKEGMEASGPGLMFVSLPMVFNQMGRMGNIVGCLFFVLVLFAALTSSVSILEAIVSSFMDRYGLDRKKATIIEGIIAAAFELLVCLGYNVLYFEYTLPNGATAQVLDIMDYISNNLLMPIISICTCILIGWVLKPDVVADEVTKNGETFKSRGLYTVMLKFIAPLLLAVLLLKAVNIL